MSKPAGIKRRVKVSKIQPYGYDYETDQRGYLVTFTDGHKAVYYAFPYLKGNDINRNIRFQAEPECEYRSGLWADDYF